eukprot:TRINITY_DN62178_c0_g1_i1.p1 TRINITY_DN62178_c0_g1~~TRINITY_DN62178_c0_g1_i1.p1  ORF type:complete len:616 (+),score=70.19 TRINITY_DN62178_c0_g1_i1:114-1850(+)
MVGRASHALTRRTTSTVAKHRSTKPEMLILRLNGKLVPLALSRPVHFCKNNPNSLGSLSYKRFERYKRATTLTKALKLGATTTDLARDFLGGHGKVGRRCAARAKTSQRVGTLRISKTVKKTCLKKPRISGSVAVDGLTALNRPFTDQKAWEQRREKEREPPGGWPTPPSHWPPGVRVDIGRPVAWLPEGWGQGVKTTCVAKLRAYISPEGKCYYHKPVVLALAANEQKQGGKALKSNTRQVWQYHDAHTSRQLEWARGRASLALADGTYFNRKSVTFANDEKLFATLTSAERAFLPRSGADLYFAVISARRAGDEKGLRHITNVQVQLAYAGVTPTWYVDEASLAAYKKIGLRAKVGGKLVPSRNMALEDAAKMGKVCVQVSDDISRWDYYSGDLGRQVDLAAGNVAAKSADRFHVSPVAAARFMLAKLRAAAKAAKKGDAAPRLAGVFPLGNVGQSFTREAVSTEHFILGDFFVVESSSPCRFDSRMTLKEDYDYTCTHLATHGAVLRCNRMFISAVHETNAGGAVSERDESGQKERDNIEILQQKWPGAFYINGKRGDTQVVMSWRRLKSSPRTG